MKNIWRVYISDLRRITTNVVALSIIMGLCIIPSLYAWFNILSNWDPYGESATSLMKISVYSEDDGIEMSGINLTIGDMVIESLENNNTIDWTFADNKDEALELIASGECYAGIIIPKEHAQHTKWQHHQSKYRILREQQEERHCHQDNRQGQDDRPKRDKHKDHKHADRGICKCRRFHFRK